MTKAEINPKAIDTTNTTVATARTGLNICLIQQAKAMISGGLLKARRFLANRLTLVS